MASPVPLPNPRPTPVPATRKPRFDVTSVVSGKIAAPIRIVVFGVDKIGKTTFGADAPDPVFVGSEMGTKNLSVDRLGPRDDSGRMLPLTWQDILDAVQIVTDEPHSWKTFVLDSLDWAEPLLWAHICQRDGLRSINEPNSFGAGYTAAVDGWRVLLAALERLWEKRQVNIILIAHSMIKSFKNPEGEDYERWQLALNEKAAGVIKQWCDCILFANYQTSVVQDKKKRIRGYDQGRMLYTERRAAHDGGNRYDLPYALPLQWGEFEIAVRAHGNADHLIRVIDEKIPQLDETTRAKATEFRTAAGDNAVKLAKLNNWINGKINLATEGEQT